MKRILIITLITIACFGGLYAYLTDCGNNGNPRFMHHRYSKVITEPLAKLGFSDAQYKMGLFWYYGGIGSLDESQIPKEEVENAVYWWEKASASGNDKATQELAKANEKLRLDSLSANGMRQVVIIHLNSYKPYDAIIRTLYDEDKNEYYFITQIKRDGKWQEIDSQLRDLQQEYDALDRSDRNKEFIRTLQSRATHVADIDGELYLFKVHDK